MLPRPPLDSDNNAQVNADTSQHVTAAGQTMLSSSTKSSNALAAKLTSVLSTSFSDAEFRDALFLFDQRGLTNDGKTRRQIRLDLHKDVIDCNGVIIDRFGRVAEVRSSVPLLVDNARISSITVRNSNFVTSNS